MGWALLRERPRQITISEETIPMSKQFTTITDAAKPEISMDDFQSLVWQLSNQLFVRHYRWLNYPQKPQLFALQFADDIANTSLEAELKSLGFAWDPIQRIWAILRKESADTDRPA
jgi:hypothetical protein